MLQDFPQASPSKLSGSCKCMVYTWSLKQLLYHDCVVRSMYVYHKALGAFGSVPQAASTLPKVGIESEGCKSIQADFEADY